MKILIVNNYFRNTGDAALLNVLIKQVRTEWPDAGIKLASLEHPAEFPTFDDATNVGSIRLYSGDADISRPRRLSRKAFVAALSFIWGRLPLSARNAATRHLPHGLSGELTAIIEADLVLSASGGYMNATNSLGGNLNIWHLLLPLKLAHQIGKPVIMAPQSFGPFGNNWQRRAVVRTVNCLEHSFVREDKSINLLTTLGANPQLISRAIDSGFAFDTDITSQSTKLRQEPRIGITARTWLPDAAQTAYEKGIAEAITAVNSKYGAHFSLIPQVTSELYEDDDRVPERRIAEFARAAGAEVEQIDTHLSHHDVKRLYAGLDITIGTRFHSVIFSLTSYVPAIAIEYEHKTSGIMHDLGLEDWVIKIGDVTGPRLTAMLERLVREHDAYVQHLRKVMPDYIARTNATGPLMKQIYERSRAGK